MLGQIYNSHQTYSKFRDNPKITDSFADHVVLGANSYWSWPQQIKCTSTALFATACNAVQLRLHLKLYVHKHLISGEILDKSIAAGVCMGSKGVSPITDKNLRQYAMLIVAEFRPS